MQIKVFIEFMEGTISFITYSDISMRIMICYQSHDYNIKLQNVDLHNKYVLS